MIFTTEEIGKIFLKQNYVMEFKKEYDKLYSLIDIDNMFFYNFFHSSLDDKNQFESFILASVFFFKEFPQNAIHLLNMVKTYCIPLALKINFILWVLNNYNCNGKILNIINLPFDDIFEKIDKKCHLHDKELKKVFESFFSENDELFALILKLRNDFQNSRIFKKYVHLSDLDEYESEYYKKTIKSQFYIIKEIIFEVILFEDIPVYNENNILKIYESTSPEGNTFDIKIIHAIINDRNIVKIDYMGCQKYAFITSKITKTSQKKGTIIQIKGEFINNGFGKYSKNMNYYSEKIDKLNGIILPPI